VGGYLAAGPGCLVESGDVSSTVAVAAGRSMGWVEERYSGGLEIHYLQLMAFGIGLMHAGLGDFHCFGF
jgi:hypothetical protein